MAADLRALSLAADTVPATAKLTEGHALAATFRRVPESRWSGDHNVGRNQFMQIPESYAGHTDGLWQESGYGWTSL